MCQSLEFNNLEQHIPAVLKQSLKDITEAIGIYWHDWWKQIKHQSCAFKKILFFPLYQTMTPKQKYRLNCDLM